MKKNLLVLTLCAGALLMTGCASKKELPIRKPTLIERIPKC